MRRAPHVLFVSAATAAFSFHATAGMAQQSLADVARQEKERRAGIAEAEKAKVYTNDDLRAGGRLTTGSSRPAATTQPDGPDGTEAPAADPDMVPGPTTAPSEEGVGGPRDEEYWRTRIASTREAKDRAELMAAALQNRVDGLWAEFTAVDDPNQRTLVEQQRQQALAELDNVQTQVETLDQEVGNIREEARRAGVPAGWLR